MYVSRFIAVCPAAAALLAVCTAQAQTQSPTETRSGAEVEVASAAQPDPAQQSAAQTSAAASASPSLAQKPQGFVGSYLARVSATQAEQPHWVTPLVTVTPRLEQELRTDFVYSPQPNHTTEWN